jgi:hypothetical protein
MNSPHRVSNPRLFGSVYVVRSQTKSTELLVIFINPDGLTLLVRFIDDLLHGKLSVNQRSSQLF